MAKVKLSRAANIDLERLATYINQHIGHKAAIEFSQLMQQTFAKLAENPYFAGYSTVIPQYREMFAAANAKRGYKLLYDYQSDTETVTILAIKDAREQSFSGF